MEKLAPESAAEALYVVFSASQHRFAVPYGVVEQMVSPPPKVRVPNAAPAVLGVINLRGNVLGLVCLRRLIGAPDVDAENAALIAELDARERDHVAWIAELEAATREHRPFALTTDPHACAFGRWYDNYRATNEEVRSQMQRFDEPHQRIHAVAHEVTALTRRGQHDEALALIDRGRSRDLARLMRLFGEVRELLGSWEREIAVVLHLEGRSPIALLVDAVESVTALDTAHTTEHGSDATLGSLFGRLATDAEGQIVNLLAVEGLYNAIAA